VNASPAGASPPSPWFDHTRIVPFGPGSYAQVHALQQEHVAKRIAGQGGDVILVGQHERVVTLGRGTKELVGGLPIPVVEIERGGQATWHGPGQLVAYPIVSLVERKRSIRDYLHALEEAILRTVAAFGVAARRRDGATGVWVGERKLASIGVAVRRFVTWHGLALNVAPDLSDFRLIRPCGFAPDVMTSMEELLRAAPPIDDVRQRLVAELVAVLGLAPPIWDTSAP
jgi:lipoyl(octanoyl) transferase